MKVRLAAALLAALLLAACGARGADGMTEKEYLAAAMEKTGLTESSLRTLGNTGYSREEILGMSPQELDEAMQKIEREAQRIDRMNRAMENAAAWLAASGLPGKERIDLENRGYGELGGEAGDTLIAEPGMEELADESDYVFEIGDAPNRVRIVCDRDTLEVIGRLAEAPSLRDTLDSVTNYELGSAGSSLKATIAAAKLLNFAEGLEDAQVPLLDGAAEDYLSSLDSERLALFAEHFPVIDQAAQEILSGSDISAERIEEAGHPQQYDSYTPSRYEALKEAVTQRATR